MSAMKSNGHSRKFKDLTGQRFGQLTVIKLSHRQIRPNKKGTRPFWRCLCVCGKETTVAGSHLVSGITKSCGCFKFASRNATHGRSRTSMYAIWMSMKQRCENPDNHAYADYGGRGISVCARWSESFESFLKDVGERPSKGHTIDRYPDRNGNYEPGNVRWATWKQQQRNRRDTIILEHEGRSMSLCDWSDERGWDRDVIYNRIRRGWSVAKALSTPLPSRTNVTQ